jgi:hypothetical protein
MVFRQENSCRVCSTLKTNLFCSALMNLYNVNELRERKYDEIIKKYIIDLKTHTNFFGFNHLL